MKKLLSTLIIVLFALTAGAQNINELNTIMFKPFAKGNNPLVFHCDDVFLYTVDSKDKMEADMSTRQFKDGARFFTRLKTGGTSGRNNQLFLSVKAKGTLTIYAASSSSDVDRQIVLIKGAKDVVTDVMEQSNRRPIVVQVEKVGEYQIVYPDGPINIYGIHFEKSKE